VKQQWLALSVLPEVCIRKIKRKPNFSFGEENTARALFIIVAG
jgi:hypothetical protein